MRCRVMGSHFQRCPDHEDERTAHPRGTPSVGRTCMDPRWHCAWVLTRLKCSSSGGGLGLFTLCVYDHPNPIPAQMMLIDGGFQFC